MAKLQSTEIVGVANIPAIVGSNSVCLWWDTTNIRLMASYCTMIGSWSTGGALSVGRYSVAGAGTQNAGLAATGGNPSSTSTEEYNGTSWSAGGAVITARRWLAGAGTQNEGLIFGGYDGSVLACTEEYNGTSWSVGGALNGARNATVGAGTQNEALAIGGSTCTEEYNGTSWSVGRTLTTGRTGAAGAGTQSAGLAAGGGSFTCTEEYTKQLTLVSKCITVNG